ncbi:MAG TPA: sugar-binding transcriptional regulator [Aerococcus urinaeequi]|nr:sugar-binding transcriptional regulator [Aerococcus urinaeequi]
MYDREKLLVQVATLYYESNLTQMQIGKRLHLSRPTVSQLLKEARDTGVVSITINHPMSKQTLDQEKISTHYSISSTHIADSSYSEEATKSKLGLLCSTYIESRLFNLNTIGIGWGSSLYHFVESANNMISDNLIIVPLMGGVGMTNIKLHANHLAFKLSEKYNADVAYFYAPAFAENKKMKEMFESSQQYQEIYQKGLQVDLAVIGIGNPLNSSTYKQLNYFSDEETKELENSDAIGDILGSFFDLEGNSISTTVTDRMLGISISDLSKIKEKVVIASGTEKYKAISVLLNNNLVDHLFIDQELANLLLENIEKGNSN